MRATTYPLTLRQLQYAVAVAETGSFRRAAERCHVAQPSLSAQIAELERGLGVVLFERGSRVLVTAAGQGLIDRARRLLVEADDLVEAARQAADPRRGTLRLGVLPTISPYLLPEVLPALRRDYPDLGVQWTEDRTAVLVERIARGDLDAALLALEAEIGGLTSVVLGNDPFVLATAPGHHLAHGAGPVELAELAGQRLLLLDDGHCFRDQALAFCARAGLAEESFRATSLATLVQMVIGGAGITLLPQIAVAAENRRGELAIRAFAAPAPRRTIALVWRPSSPLGPLLREVAAVLRAAALEPPIP